MPSHQFGTHFVVDDLGGIEVLRGKAAGEKKLISPGQAKVPEQNCGALTETIWDSQPLTTAMHAGKLAVGRGKSTTSIRAVHNIVMDESACLQEFKGTCSGNHRVALASFTKSGAPAPVAKEWTQTLPPVQQGFGAVPQWECFRPNCFKNRLLFGQELIKACLDLRANIRVRCVTVGHFTHGNTLLPRYILHILAIAPDKSIFQALACDCEKSNL